MRLITPILLTTFVTFCLPSPLSASACDTGIATPVGSFETPEELQSRLDGVWLYCGTDSDYPALGSTKHDGIEVTQDGHVYMIRRDESGRLVRKTGFAHEFLASIHNVSVDETPRYAWALDIDTGSTSIAPHFTEAFDTMRLDNMGNTSVYAKTTQEVAVRPINDLNVRTGSAGCGKEEALVVHKATSARDVRRFLIGKWWDCKLPVSEEFDPLLPNHVFGIAFERDGTWRHIVTKDGQLGSAQEDSGPYEIEKVGLNYQINVHLPDGTTAALSWAYAQAPIKMHLEGVFFSDSTLRHTNAILSAMPEE